MMEKYGIEQTKCDELVKLGCAVSLAEARRLVASGMADKLIKRASLDKRDTNGSEGSEKTSGDSAGDITGK